VSVYGKWLGWLEPGAHGIRCAFPFLGSTPARYNRGMSFRSLGSFLDELARDGRLVRVREPVGADLEIAEIAARTQAAGGPAVLFENVRERTGSVVTGLLAETTRLCRALDVAALDDLVPRFATLAGEGRRGWLDRLTSPGAADVVDRFRPKLVRVADAQQVVKLGADINLEELPALRCRSEETCARLSPCLVLTHDAESGIRSVASAVLPIVGRNRLAALWSPYSTAGRHLTACAKIGEKLPVSVVVGGEPVTMVAASLPCPPEVDPLAFAGLLAETPVEIVGCRTQEVQTLANAEIVLEGYVDPEEPTIEAGVCSMATGLLRPMSGARVIHVTALTERNNPILVADVPVARGGEQAARTRLLERFVAPLLKVMTPDVVDLALPALGTRDGFAFLSIRKRRPHHARQLANAVWAIDALMATKIVVVVDEDVDVHDTERVLNQVAANVWPERDVNVWSGPSDPFDAAVAGAARGQKMLIDATSKLAEECDGPWMQRATMSEEIRKLVDDRWDEYGLEG